MSSQNVFSPLRLTNSVTYSGRGFWGGQKSITLHSASHSEWSWLPSESIRPIPIIPSFSECTRSRIRLIGTMGQTLEVFEHIGALRYAGLVGVQIEGEGWPPYDGCSKGLWELVKSNSREVVSPLKIYTVQRSVRGTYSNRFDRNGVRACTEIHPSTD